MFRAIIMALFVFTMTDKTFADIKYVDGYYRSNGQYVSGHYKDTSGDGNPYNNARNMGF